MAAKVPVLLALFLGLFSASAWAAGSPPTVQLHHFLLQPGPRGSLLVQERVVLDNPGDPLPPGSVRFYVPQGAQEVSASGEGSGALVAAEGAMIAQAAVPAGQSNFAFGYVLPPGAPHFVLVQKSDYPTQAVYVLTPPAGMAVQGEGIEDRGTIELNGKTVRVYAGGPVGTGQEMLIAVVGGKGGGAAGRVPTGGYLNRMQGVKFHNPGHIRLWYQSPFRGINAHLFLVIVLGAPLSAGLIHLFRRKRKKAAAASKVAETEEQLFQRLLAREKVLLAKLVDLERQRREQGLTDVEYGRLREAYRGKLVQVKLQLREFVS